jgi:predicted dehydrogenase
MIRAAIVGLGWWGRTLVEATQGKSKAIQFVAGQTRSPARAADFCRHHHIDLRDDFEDLLRDPKIDAIVSATPHRDHEEQIAHAATAGKHIYIEKPLALTLREAERSIAKTRAAGIVLAVGFQRRHSPSHLALKARIERGELGSIVHCAGEATAPGALTLARTSWRSDPDQMPGGAITPLGIHMLDGMIDLFGEIENVSCINLRRGSPYVDDTTSTLMSFCSGASGTLVSSMTTTRTYRMMVYGTKASAEALRNNSEAFNLTPVPLPAPSSTSAIKPETINFPRAELEKDCLEAFAAAIGSKHQFPIAAQELLHGVAVFEAIVRSAATRQTIKVLPSRA